MSWAFELIDVYAEPAAAAPLRGVSLGARRGEVTAVLGPRGAGKTTVFRLLAGLERPTTGAVLVSGREVSRARRGELRRIQRRLATVFGAGDGSFALFAGATVRDNVEFAMRAAGRVPARRMRAVADAELARFGLGDLTEAEADLLDEGQRKSLALARATALRAPLMIVDDLEAGLDDEGVERVCAIVRDDCRQHGTSWLITTSSDEVAGRVADAVEELVR